MSPWQLEKLVQRCAKWIFTKQQEHGGSHPLWWTPAVLTSSNPDISSLRLSLTDATLVFCVLNHRELLIPKTVSITNPEGQLQDIAVFIINPNSTKQWEQFLSKSGFWNLSVLPTLDYIFANHPWLIGLLTFIAASFFGQLFSNLADDIYPLLRQICNTGK